MYYCIIIVCISPSCWSATLQCVRSPLLYHYCMQITFLLICNLAMWAISTFVLLLFTDHLPVDLQPYNVGDLHFCIIIVCRSPSYWSATLQCGRSELLYYYCVQITFLLICNLAMWAISTFETSRADAHPTLLNYYGVWAWTIISHVSMPLAIFYRFHATVCLCEIWKRAYKLKPDFIYACH